MKLVKTTEVLGEQALEQIFRYRRTSFAQDLEAEEQVLSSKAEESN